MNRRHFFGLFAGAAATAIAVPELELLVPSRTIFLPPVGGWRSGNPLLTAQAIARELLAVFEANLVFAGEIDREYDPAFLAGSQWTPAEMTRPTTINIRRPVSYDVRVDVGPERWQAGAGDLRTIEGVLRR